MSEQIARLVASRFIERLDAKAIQQGSGYAPVRENMRDTNSPLIPWSGQDVIDHIEGRVTYGHYMVKPEANTCRCIVFDFDLRDEYVQVGEDGITETKVYPREIWQGEPSPMKKHFAMSLKVLADGFARRAKNLLDVPVMVTYSGHKGMHTYVCLDPGTPAAEAREVAHIILTSLEDFEPDKGRNFWRHRWGYPEISIEVYPKQDTVSGNGFGNLIRLPLGLNQGGQSFFMDLSCGIDEFKIDDPLEALTHGSLR